MVSFTQQQAMMPAIVAASLPWQGPAQLPGRLVPPRSGPVPNNAPVRGASVPLTILMQWLPPDAVPQPPKKLTPPQSGPTPSAPPVRGPIPPGLLPLLIGWDPPYFRPIVQLKVTP